MKEWYGILLSLGFILLIISLTIKIIPITNLQLFYGSLTFFLIGIGEFKNHKSYSGIKPANAYTGPTMEIRYKIREPDILGSIFDLIGFFFLILFVFSFL